MAITQYKKDGKLFYKVYVNLRSKEDPKIRIQRSVKDLTSMSQARREELKIHQDLTKEILLLEGKCKPWEEIIYSWKREAESGVFGNYNPATILERARHF